MIISRTDMKPLFTASTATTALPTDGSAPIPTVTKPTYAVDCSTAPAIRFVFGGTGNADTNINYRVLTWTLAGLTYVPSVIASGVATLGAMVMTTTDLDTAATKLCDTITNTMGTPGIIVQSPANNTMASIIVIPGASSFITVETDLGTATTASVYWQTVDEAAGASFNTAGQSALYNSDYVVSAAYTATITATAVIPTAFTATLPADLVRLVLIPRGDVYWKIGGAATASTALVAQASPLGLPVTKTLADTIQVYGAGAGVVCDLLVCTPR